MLEWTPFRDAFAAGLPDAARLEHLRTVEGWLDLAAPAASAALAKELESVPAKTLYQSLIVLNLALQREVGIPPGPEAQAALQKLMADVQANSASDAQRASARRLAALWQLGGELLEKYPAANQPPSAAQLAKAQLQQAGTAIFARIDAVRSQTVPGTVTPESIATIEKILSDGDTLIASAEPGNEGLPDVLYLAGAAARTLAGCYAISGRNDEALRTFAKGADYFTRAGEQAQADDCRNRASSLEQKLTGSLDAAAAQPLASLNKPGEGDPFTRIKALMDLCDVAREAGDTFEGLDKAEAAAALLASLGYPDPGKCGAEAAVSAWIATASASGKGVPMLARFSQVGQWFDGIFGARYAVLVGKGAATSGAVLELQAEVQELALQASGQARRAQADQRHVVRRYFPDLPELGPEVTPSGAVPDFGGFMKQCRRVDNALGAIRDACNERSGKGDPMDDLLEATRQLQTQADVMNSPEYEAKTRLGEAYILGSLGRGPDLIPVAEEARRRLLAGRAPSLSSLPEASQRYLYLDSLNRETMGHIMAGEFEAGLEITQATIRDYETERYRINSEFRQSAMLGYVADFYKWAAFCAFKLQKWDDMLQAIDLIKARSAIRSRLLPDPPESLESDTAREFDELSVNKSAASTDDAEEKRRQLWDLLSITRSQNGSAAEMPELTVSTLQSSLAEDEALVSYFWLNDTVLLATAVDRNRFHAERIMLEPEQRAALDQFVSFIQQLKHSHNMDRPVAKLGEFLLPAFLRDFISAKKRIVFSPHHSLHLFPFHAARWDDGFVGTQFAVRYVPNASSLVLPWNRQPENRILGIGIGEFADPAVSPLSNVEADVRAIQQYYEAGGTAVETMLGKEATRQRVEEMRRNGELSKFRCVHLGTHGLSVFETPNQPLESRLLLQNGALDAMDIANLRLNAELAVMSACHSGQRAIQMRNLGDLPGDDIFGLQSALFKSGVRSILGTLWLVETASASAITRAFHRHFAQGEPAEVALQQAVKEYISDASAPRGVYYWAPYFIASIGSKHQGGDQSPCPN